ncbi:TPA: hypothetical protein ACT2E0_002227, partial [Streptococcus suis]
LFIIGHMGLFVYTQKGSIISTVVLPTTEIIEPFLGEELKRALPQLFTVESIKIRFSSFHLPETKGIFL